MASNRRLFLTASAGLIAIALAGCFTSYVILTPEELAQRGTRTFPGATTAQAVEAAAVALKSLGYEVIQKAPDTGVVKTAPQVVLSTAETTATVDRSVITDRVEGAHGTTTETRDALAWTLRISSEGDSVKIVATPRAYRNGDEITENAFAAEVMDPKFEALWREIKDSMPAPGAAPTTPSASASADAPPAP